jgi:CPA1 family monovalent cation:H+ antiporter
VLFLLIGLEVVTVAGSWSLLALGLLAIPVVLAARAGSIAAPLAVLSVMSPLTRGSFPILLWGGLRGGISIALALSLPVGPAKEVILAATYAVVIFSVIVQGATVGAAAKRFLGQADAR